MWHCRIQGRDSPKRTRRSLKSFKVLGPGCLSRKGVRQLGQVMVKVSRSCHNFSLFVARGIMKKIVFAGLFLGMLSGCYTQFSTLDEHRQPPVSKVTYEIDSATGDTVKVVSQIDTIIKKENQHCYWTRNLWGEPELRCDNSYYSQDWYVYNDYPWWYNRDPYMYDAYGRCPQYFYYDESCRSCRHYTDRDYYYRGSGYGGGAGSGPSSSNVAGKNITKRTRSSNVPNPSATGSSSGMILNKGQKTQSNATSNNTQQNERRLRTRSSDVPVQGNSNVSFPPSNSVPEASQAKTTVSPPSPPPAPPIQETGQTNQQSNPPPAPSPPPSNSNQNGGQNGSNHRNPRSW